MTQHVRDGAAGPALARRYADARATRGASVETRNAGVPARLRELLK